MNSILSYPDRGKYGNRNYRGNCSGHVIADLLNYYKPKKVVEVFSGGGTGKDVCDSLGITNSVHLDLNNGWNALTDDMPTGSDFVFSHPPYWDIINYQSFNGNHPDDLSLNISYDEFITKLNQVNAKIYQSLQNGGRHAFLVGDVRKRGQYYQITKDMTFLGEIEDYFVKVQHNAHSDRKTYKGSFIPIKHEHLYVFRKTSIWNVPLKVTKTFTYSLKEVEQMTWRDLIQAALDQLGGQSDLNQLYEVIKPTKKARQNKHFREKIRQTLQVHDNFSSVQRGVWCLDIAQG